MDKKANNHQTSSKNGITIISVAALSFAVVSWKATAEGLDAYVFENGWQSMLISFAIQSILFVFNLRLPFYYKHIGEMQKVREKKKYRFGPKKGTEKNTYKSTVFQKVILAFYIVTLLSSSFFLIYIFAIMLFMSINRVM